MLKGSIIAQIFGVIGTIFLAKIYGPKAYGLYGVFYSISRVLSILFTLQLEKSIVTASTKKAAIRRFNTSILISLILTFVSLILINIVNFVLPPQNLLIIVYGITGAIIISINSTNEALFTFQKKFKVLAKSKIILTFSSILFQFILYLKFELMGLIFGGITSLVVVLVFYSTYNYRLLSINKLNSLKTDILSQKNIILYLFPSNLINSTSIHIMPIALAFFFSLEDVGIYFFSLKILSIPLFLISSSISNVYFQKASAIFNTKKRLLFNFSKRIVFWNFIIIIFALLLINTIGISFLEFFYSKDWVKLREFMLIISFLIICKSLFNPISNIIIVLNKNDIGLIFNLYLLFISALAIFVGVINKNIIYTLYTLTAFSSIGYLVLLFFFMNKLFKYQIDES